MVPNGGQNWWLFQTEANILPNLSSKEVSFFFLLAVYSILLAFLFTEKNYLAALASIPWAKRKQIAKGGFRSQRGKEKKTFFLFLLSAFDKEAPQLKLSSMRGLLIYVHALIFKNSVFFPTLRSRHRQTLKRAEGSFFFSHKLFMPVHKWPFSLPICKRSAGDSRRWGRREIYTREEEKKKKKLFSD